MDERYMKLALKLAEKGRGKVNPNPMVGAVLVKEGIIIGKGYHRKYGENHAEIEAFLSASTDVEGATMYVNLEPCAHYGRTPPCVDKIIEKKIKKVVIASADPNPLVSGKGIKKLREAGIEVITGVLDKENKKLNEVFMKYIKGKKPFVIMKIGSTLDGKIATSKGESKWITSNESRIHVHQTRGQVTGILVGVNTVIKDNPELTCRIDGGKNPIRIILDTNLRIPMDSKVIKDNKSKTIVVTTSKDNLEKISTLKENGIELLIARKKGNRVDLKDTMSKLGDLGIDSILLEGGSTLNFSSIKEGIVDKIQIYIGGKIIGGEKSKTSVGGEGVELLKEAFMVRDMTTENIGADILVEGYLERRD